MPKENITSVSHDNTRAELYWYRDNPTIPGWVHLTTVNTDLERDDPVPQHYKGFEVTLDEAGIDRLIKTLHKATRQAFGGTDRDRTAGICGNRAPQISPDGQPGWCELRHGHSGWHGQGEQHWTGGAPHIIGDKPDPGGWIPTGTNDEGYWQR